VPLKPVSGRLSYRAVDVDTGAELISYLPHTGGSWTVRALQPGQSGAASLGDFAIQLPAPRAGLGRRYRDQLLSLAKGQRIEAFLGDSVTGTPAFSGNITENPRRTLDGWEITGKDSLWLLQQSQVIPGEISLQYPWSGVNFVKRFSGTHEVQWDDDFTGFGGGTGPHPSSDYNVSGFAYSAADPYLGLPSITSTTTSPTIAYITSKTLFAVGTGPWTWSETRATGTMVAGTDSLQAAELSIFILADGGNPPQNGLMCSAFMRETGVGSGVWAVIATINSLSGGVYSGIIATTAFSAVQQRFPCQVSALIYFQNAQYHVKVLVNGKDSGCVWDNPNLSGSGRIGLRHSPAAAGGPIVYVNRLGFQARTSQFEGNSSWGTNRFQPGTQETGTLNGASPIPLANQSHLDMINLAAAFDNKLIRKNAGYGFKADTLDYATSPGTDLSSTVTFEEGTNVTAAEIAPASQLFARDLRINAVPGGDSGGSIWWERIGAAGDIVIRDTVADLGVPGFQLLIMYARAAQAKAASPNLATQLTVTRHADLADKWRELDFVNVNLRSLAIYNQRSQIVGYTYVEGSAEQTVWLSDFPDRALLAAALRRSSAAIAFISGTYQVR
jgi:hypothetical protein